MITRAHTIVEDPTILSGTLRSTLDIREEYEDAEIVRAPNFDSVLYWYCLIQYEALRRVHLIPSSDEIQTNTEEEVNENVFRNLDSPVSEAGENFSAGEKQLIWWVLCIALFSMLNDFSMARAILKRTKVLFMDEATAR